MINSKNASVLVGLAALLGLVANQGCSSDNSAGPGTPTAGATAGGAPPGTAGAAAAGTSGGGTAGIGAAGAAAGGAGASGSGAGGAGAGGAAAGAGGIAGGSAGTGGASGGSGGVAGGSGGASGGSGGAAGGSAGGTAVSFAAVKTLFSTSCGVGGCHNAASKELNYQTTTDLHALLIAPIPTGINHCVGTTPVVPNDQSSYLLAVVKGNTTCPKGTGNVSRMPDGCSTAAGASKPCLTDAQIKTLSDWIAAGAPAN